MTRILVVEDHEGTRRELCETLVSCGYDVARAASASEAISILREQRVDLVLSDYRMQPLDGLELLRSVRRTVDVPFILYSAGADAEAIFQAGKSGAFLFLEYPFRVEDQLLPTIEEALGSRRDVAERTVLQGADRLVGCSSEIHRVREKIRRVARSQACVLVTGETGTGKELVARAIHEESGRGPFLALSVPELSETVLESELFGHVRGAFTGAHAAHAGFFERADGGTLFLDEIGDAPEAVQAKLLRVLETGEVRRLGSEKARTVDTRFVTATHRDLNELVAAGAFRKDLHYRIRQAAIHLPPLRDHKGDLELLTQALLQALAEEARLPVPKTTEDFLAVARRQAWLGNVRELRTFLQNVVLAWDATSPLDQQDAIRALSSLHPERTAADQLTFEAMLDAYQRHGGNQEAARRELDLSRGEWRHRWRLFGLDAIAGRRR
jgi:DNA-binding NtrC family response regulator